MASKRVVTMHCELRPRASGWMPHVVVYHKHASEVEMGVAVLDYRLLTSIAPVKAGSHPAVSCKTIELRINFSTQSAVHNARLSGQTLRGGEVPDPGPDARGTSMSLHVQLDTGLMRGACASLCVPLKRGTGWKVLLANSDLL